MSCGRVLLCLIFPPLAVYDKGCGTIVLITVLTLVGWVPGIIGALVVCSQSE
ncbi:MAG: YqaE/Pmp3 family membrane protein [Armatimonadota bacterium]